MGLPPSTRPRWWGPWFPDAGSFTRKWWGPWFPDAPDGVPPVPPAIPNGAGEFVLVLESGTTVTYEYAGSLTKSKSGLEKRTSTSDFPVVTISSHALLIGDSARVNRGKIAKFAAIGKHFLLGLPYEDIAITEDSPSYAISVDPLHMTYCDWANPGQRVIIEDFDGNTADATVQGTAPGIIYVNPAPGDVARRGSRIMPAIGFFLDPNQTFLRYATEETVEDWSISGVAKLYDFAGTVARPSSLKLDPPQTNSGALDNITFVARHAGVAGNNIRIRMSADALGSPPGELIDDGTNVDIHFAANETSTQQLINMVNNLSTTIYCVGTPVDPFALLQDGDDEFDWTFLDGGYDSVGVVGNGVNLTEYLQRPVWDRRLIAKDGTAQDQLQSLARIAVMAGIPFTSTFAKKSEFARQIFYRRTDVPEWQWLKKFVHTVRGSWKSFYLPTWRHDLIFDSASPGHLVVRNGEQNGDFFAWFRTYHEHLQILLADDSVIYCQITAATVVLDTIDLTLVDGDGVPVDLTAEDVTMISWLELVRFENKKLSVEWSGAEFKFDELARVVIR